MVLRAIVIDDEEPQRSLLKHRIMTVCNDEVIVVAEAFSVNSAIDEIQKHKPDIVFLDIEIIGGTGFDVLDVFDDPNFAVIFVTSHPQFAVQAFRYKAIDYILKPIDIDNLSEAIQRVYVSYSFIAQQAPSILKVGNNVNTQLPVTQGQSLSISLGKSLRIIKTENILFCEAQGNYTKILFTDGTQNIVTQQLGSLEEKLLQMGFLRIHRSYIVNAKFIDEIIPKAKQCSIILRYEQSEIKFIELEVSQLYRTSLINYFS
ncbi:MAG: LytTR family DNA-binding domain-containing protein [Candidatus Kapabacteria bacterium]|jgi:two-component system LytT family response regulator|nr:LytTR family DNA-binding domain-containing protein [Candidatus Kapabacteria bacterium]